MIKIDAYWEERNFDKKVLEIKIDANDSADCLLALEDDYATYDYIVAKVPKLRLDLVHGLEEVGFRFMESQIEMTLNLTKFIEPSRFSKVISEPIQFQTIDAMEQLKDLLSKIDEDLFVTDRVSLDPALGSGLALKRYKNWIRDGFLSGNAIIVEATLKSNKIGFYFFLKGKDKTIHAVLASLYKDYRRRAIGVRYMKEILTWSAKEGYTKMNLMVSSNNLEALRAYSSIGFEMKEIYYILRRVTR
ncbi:GNAT family N-acetyltransferase [Cohnella terricola]|uniref:GNAT family N-acetyltransferase n=1 Tax=Cohnella terricola TaxID=1289167 RepID=A0A559JFK0_9BACL|nr:GNAT family N-acetyltransferase [Cohnella terricola]TVX98650.1 GNAT family N-acetyltransferase [Cohnella terricola]